MSTVRGDSPRFLKLSMDRKVSPRGVYQESRDRWLPQMPNSFGLPAGVSCPGKTDFCKSCYAVSSERSSGVHDLVTHNYRLLTAAGTEDAMADLLAEMIDRFVRVAEKARLTEHERIFRIHWDGDFFSIDYARAWARVIHMFPSITFWAYTRSFVEPVNVVPVLAGVENLALYLSVDMANMQPARELADKFGIRLALCGVDYSSARALSDRRSVVCPENAGKMPLMKDGVGACVDCRLCVDARVDVVFSTSHREVVTVAAPRLRRDIRPKTFTSDVTPVCATPGCKQRITRRQGPGRPPKFCEDCRKERARKGRAYIPSAADVRRAVSV